MYQEVVSADVRAAPAVFREYSEVNIDIPTVPRARYVDKAFFDLEIARMWPRVWQLACREEEIPEVGDCLPYESPGASLLLVRSGESEIKGYYNTCRHRGMKLCAAEANFSQIRCPYHGFTWNLDGTLARIPSAWDFPHIDKSSFGLAEVRVARWGGFVFVNRDPGAASLESYLANLPAHFADWPFDSMYLAVVIRKEIQANWKTCIEGFIESMHVAELHSQATPFSGDSSTQYDVWPGNENISRFLEPSGIPSEEHPSRLDEQQVYAAMLRVMTGSDRGPPLPAGVRARTAMAELSRSAATAADGRDYGNLSDTEALDPAQYSIFPNIVTFRTLGFPFVYRFLPMRDDPCRTRFDFMILRPKPAGGTPLPEVKRIELGADDTYSACGALPPWLGQIYDQDSAGLAQVQEGLRAGGPENIVLAQYQEVRIRHLHQTLMRYLSEPIKSAGAR